MKNSLTHIVSQTSSLEVRIVVIFLSLFPQVLFLSRNEDEWSLISATAKPVIHYWDLFLRFHPAFVFRQVDLKSLPVCGNKRLKKSAVGEENVRRKEERK